MTSRIVLGGHWGRVWGRVEWTATAGAMIARKEYRYVSPSFMPAAGQIVRLNGAGLVHKPALRLKALAHEEPPIDPQFQRPDPARYVPIEAVRALMADRNTRLATLREQDATAKVSAAMRDWATAHFAHRQPMSR